MNALIKIVRVKQVMCLFATGLAQELLVELLDVGVLVTLAQGLALVLAIYGSSTGLENLDVAMVIGLSSAADATTGASHYLNHMVVEFTGTQQVHHLAGIAQRVGYTNAQRETVKVDLGLTDTLQTTNIVELDVRQGLTCVHLIYGAQCSLHHTTGVGKDGTSTSRFAQG